MRPYALAVLLTAAMAVLADGPATTQQLVEAAKGAKARRKASTTRVITNADVKKSKGKIGQTARPAIAIEEGPSETLTERHEAAKKAAAAAEARLAAARKDVADLEKTVAAIEQEYYDESDLNRRDTEVVRRFDAAKAKLDAARTALEDLVNSAPPPASNTTTID